MQMIKGNHSKNVQSRVMVVIHDTPSECASQMYEVSSKYLLQFSSYSAADRTDARGKQYVSNPSRVET